MAGEAVVGSPVEGGAKAIFQNWGLRQNAPDPPFLQRRLHLWFEIPPPEINMEDPWTDEPPFDACGFLLPTARGLVAPGRWKFFSKDKHPDFKGVVGDFLARVYFRQEVLSKYEGASGFKVSDDGSVNCRNYWGLSHGVMRIGNEFLSTNIGDFAQGVPFEEWPHWKQFSVEPPSQETISSLCQEQTIPEAVNSLASHLRILNVTFSNLAGGLEVTIPEPLWQGSLDSLVGRQLKWNYPTVADDDEFLKRATLLSTFVIDGLVSAALRKLLQAWKGGLHLDGRRRSLGSRKLLERVSLIASLINELQPTEEEIPRLIRQAEEQASSDDPDLQLELKKCWEDNRAQLAPLAFLYDLRTHGGLAHPPNPQKVADAAVSLGLPARNWHRTDYLRLLELVAGSIAKVDERLSATL